MATKERKETWKRNTSSRRARIIAAGGHLLNVLLEPEAAIALNALTWTSAGVNYKEVISGLLLKEARRRKIPITQQPAQADDHSK